MLFGSKIFVAEFGKAVCSQPFVVTIKDTKSEFDCLCFPHQKHPPELRNTAVHPSVSCNFGRAQTSAGIVRIKFPFLGLTDRCPKVALWCNHENYRTSEHLVLQKRSSIARLSWCYCHLLLLRRKQQKKQAKELDLLINSFVNWVDFLEPSKSTRKLSWGGMDLSPGRELQVK